MLFISSLTAVVSCAEHIPLKNYDLEITDVIKEVKPKAESTEYVTPGKYLAFRFSLDRSLEDYKDSRLMLWAECHVLANGASIAYSRSDGPFTVANNKVLPDSLDGPNFIAFGFQGMKAYSEDTSGSTPLTDLPFDRIDCQLTYRTMVGWRLVSDVASYSRQAVLRIMSQTPRVISAQE